MTFFFEFSRHFCSFFGASFYSAANINQQGNNKFCSCYCFDLYVCAVKFLLSYSKLDSIVGSRLSLDDSAFIEEIEKDVRVFIDNPKNKRVLVFPPVSNFRRFLIHKIVEESFPTLKTFSIGQDETRRTVVCFLSDYQPDREQPEKRARTMPSVGIYRPPAARKPTKNVGHVEAAEEKNVNMPNTSNDKQRRQRRPDMAVYIPRGQRIAQEHQRKLEAISMSNDGLELQLSNTPFEELDSNSDGEKQERLPITILSDDDEPPPPPPPSSQNEESPISIQFTEITESKKPTSLKKDEKLNPDELDWDVLYDESGECLDPSILGQLTTAVGDVSIETPKTTYDEYKQRNIADEFPNVVEIYNFPVEFKTQDLVTVFSDFKHVDFDIRWVDDTHALGIFNNAAIIPDVLSMQHPFVKTRCFAEASQKSKLKARKCIDFLMPATPRPDTCAALARRLVTGALGVKLPTQRAEREAERKILREAREKKRLAAKQREEAWEGTFS